MQGWFELRPRWAEIRVKKRRIEALNSLKCMFPRDWRIMLSEETKRPFFWKPQHTTSCEALTTPFVSNSNLPDASQRGRTSKAYRQRADIWNAHARLVLYRS